MERNHRNQFHDFSENYIPLNSSSLSKNYVNVISGILVRTHFIMLLTFSYAQHVRVYGSNVTFDPLCRQYYNLSNTTQRLIHELNRNGIETNEIYNNLVKLSEINATDDREDTFSEVTILEKLISQHQGLLDYINANFNITPSKVNSNTCELILERTKHHRHIINELMRVKNQLINSTFYVGQLN